MSRLIIDCGASHARYAWIEAGQVRWHKQTSGFSPISQAMEALPHLDVEELLPQEIYFYCTALVGPFVGQAQKIWQSRYPNAQVFVGSDLEAAALACCGNNAGYIHILGTGSAVNFWDGSRLHHPKINLGYIWEDYASGYDIGKSLVQRWMEDSLDEEEQEEMKHILGPKKSFISKLYSSNNIKSYLASLSPLLDKLKTETQKNILNERLSVYFTKNIDNFADTNPHHFVGSLAVLMQDLIRSKLKESGKKIGNILPNTMDALCNYYI